MTLRRVRPEELEELARFCARHFEAGPDYFLRRWRADPAYRPPMLQAWATSKDVDPGKITGSVCADDPMVTLAD